MSSPNGMTVLTSVFDMYATKRIRRDRKTGKVIKAPYGLEKFFKVHGADLAGFKHLCQCLDRLTARPFSFVVRGEPVPGINTEKTRRLCRDDPGTGEPATFVETPRRWFAVDIDKVACPAAIDATTDPDGAVEYLICLLPPELGDASCWWQLTASQGLPGCEDTVSARLWFWLDQPLEGPALTRWAVSANKRGKIVDASLYCPVQPHYVAHPIFECGIYDPLPRRHGVRVGLDEAVSLVVPQPSAEDPYTTGDGYVGVGVEGHLAEIGGERGFRAPMVSAVAAYYTLNGADADPEPIKQRVRAAIQRAPCGDRTVADIARYRSERHLNDIIGWVRARERANPRPQKPSFSEMLARLGSAVPVGAQRQTAVRVLAGHLIRRLYEPRLAASLVASWNAIHCAPPLSDEQVAAIITAVAAQHLRKLGAQHAS